MSTDSGPLRRKSENAEKIGGRDYTVDKSRGGTIRMMSKPLLFAVLAVGVLLSSCSHKDQAASSDSAPHVTVTMRDGSRVGGMLTENSATKITVAGDDGISRTIPVSQVGTVNYDSAPPAAVNDPAPMPAAAQPPTPSRLQPQPPAGSAAPRRPADRPASALPPPPPPPPRMRACSRTERWKPIPTPWKPR